MKPMLPTLSTEVPKGSEWVYETKYDGFRAILIIKETTIDLISRNGKDLNQAFPEIIAYIETIKAKLSPFLPLTLDGEVSCLKSQHFASFEHIQIRGRLKSKDKIAQASKEQPCHFLAFDLLMIKGETLVNQPLQARKQELETLFSNVKLPTKVDNHNTDLIQYVPYVTEYSKLWKKIKSEDGEGVIAKRLQSKWEAGSRTKQWLKIKNYKQAIFFITGYDKVNGYFHVAVLKNKQVLSVGVFSHGISSEERDALLTTIKQNMREESRQLIEMDPAICIEIQFLSLYKGQLREPSFFAFRFDKQWEECTWEQLQLAIAPISEEVIITHPDKPLWETTDLSKEQYINYLLQISPYMLPFLRNRTLTVIRFPHGMFGEAFYQKNRPDYAPAFIQTVKHDDIEYIICNDLSSLIWLGNQLAIEFHLPFQTIDTSSPIEIVFDLDPPSRDVFPLAIKAALEMKKIFDQFGLVTFPKLSGNKGLQIHIPLSKNAFTYDETRVFTAFIAEFLVTSFPDDFTIERLKKNRGNRLYLDYIQHAEGKTIISPYSLRGKKEGAYIAAPLNWEEVNDDLHVSNFTIERVLERVEMQGCPFQNYFSSPQDDVLRSILEVIKNSG
ncbi:DNA ligase D [Metabacillus herbersteinensis]|uniref:DNA ligase (ATP) n=1 Tax=Metabacillus herbersteinensis TaxID=283816 RepID=A0ABV6GJ60_9BACI